MQRCKGSEVLTDGFRLNEHTGYLEIPVSRVAEGVAYAEQRGFGRIRVMNPVGGDSCDHVALDVSALAGQHFIEALDIGEGVHIKKTDFSPLYALKNLKMLCMAYVKGVVDFCAMQGLETLYITGASAEMEPLVLPKLKSLLLVSVKNTDCSFLSQLAGLEDLRISGGRFVSLDGLAGLHKLTSLRLDHCPKLADVSAVNAVQGLSDLYVEKCKLLHDFSFLAGHEGIESLFVSELDSVAFVPAMSKLRALHFWSVKDGDLSSLGDSASLEEVAFFPQKRHYSHTQEQVNAWLEERKHGRG